MDRRVKLGDIEFSVVTEEKPRDIVTITDHQVESGQDVSDHVKQEASILDIVGVMIGDDASQKLNQLKKYQIEGKLLKYVGRNIYNDMAILVVDRNHGKNVKNGFEFNISLKQVSISTAKAIEINVVNPATKKADKKTATKVKKKVNNGKQQTKTKKVSNNTKEGKVRLNPSISTVDIFKIDNSGPGGRMDALAKLYTPQKKNKRSRGKRAGELS